MRPLNLRPALATGALLTALTAPASLHAQSGTIERPFGVGMVFPILDADRPLYFYARPDLSWSADPGAAQPRDSLVFTSGPHHLDIGYAPPWLSAAYVKLDYDLMTLRALSVGREWVEVLVNDADPLPRTFPRSMWVRRDAVDFRPWSDFLLGVFAVEPVEPASNPVRSGPGSDFPVVTASIEGAWGPLLVSGDWIHVVDLDGTKAETVRGWIRWRDGDRLLVDWAFLS